MPCFYDNSGKKKVGGRDVPVRAAAGTWARRRSPGSPACGQPWSGPERLRNGSPAAAWPSPRPAGWTRWRTVSQFSSRAVKNKTKQVPVPTVPGGAALQQTLRLQDVFLLPPPDWAQELRVGPGSTERARVRRRAWGGWGRCARGWDAYLGSRVHSCLKCHSSSLSSRLNGWRGSVATMAANCFLRLLGISRWPRWPAPCASSPPPPFTARLLGSTTGQQYLSSKMAAAMEEALSGLVAEVSLSALMLLPPPLSSLFSGIFHMWRMNSPWRRRERWSTSSRLT